MAAGLLNKATPPLPVLVTALAVNARASRDGADHTGFRRYLADGARKLVSHVNVSRRVGHYPAGDDEKRLIAHAILLGFDDFALPASVLTTPADVILRMTWFCASAT